MPLMTIIAAEGPNGRFLPSDIYEFWWGALAFSVIAFFIWKKAVPLLKAALVKGQEQAIADATAAERAVADAKAKIAAASAELGDANAQSEQIIADATEAARQLRVDSATRTQQLVNDMWAKAQNDVVSMKVQANSDIQAEVASQAVGAAEEVVKASLDSGSHSELIENYISGLRTS